MKRHDMIEKRLLLDEETFLLNSRKIREQLIQIPAFVQAQTVGVYVSMQHEVDTLELIEDMFGKKHICVPRVHGRTMAFYEITSWNQLEDGTFGVKEPVDRPLIDKHAIDVMIVPLLYYDDHCHRIGYGGGYYDRYLCDYSGMKIGLAFSFQKVADTHPKPHDVPLDMILTEKNVIFRQ